MVAYRGYLLDLLSQLIIQEDLTAGTLVQCGHAHLRRGTSKESITRDLSPKSWAMTDSELT